MHIYVRDVDAVLDLDNSSTTKIATEPSGRQGSTCSGEGRLEPWDSQSEAGPAAFPLGHAGGGYQQQRIRCTLGPEAGQHLYAVLPGCVATRGGGNNCSNYGS